MKRKGAAQRARGRGVWFQDKGRDTPAVTAPGLEVESVSVTAQATLGQTFEPALLERARMQWHFGEWHSLAALDDDELRQHPERAKLALLACTANLQIGDNTRARHLARLARSWNCDKRTMARVLTAGIHNTLGRAGLLAGLSMERIGTHFQHAVEGLGAGDLKLAWQARINSEIRALADEVGVQELGRQVAALPSEPTAEASDGAGLSTTLLPNLRSEVRATLRVRRKAIHDLGLAWAGNTINTVIFRHHGVLTDGGFQFTAFYLNDCTLRLVRRDLRTDAIEATDLAGNYNLHDAHNSISLGTDRNGYVHISYDHHGTQLRYRRSLQPWSVSGWSEELPMTGAHEERVTYPSFLQPPAAYPESPLMLLYRDGIWNCGTARIKAYDEASGAWTDRPEPVLSGAEQKPWTSNAYWNHPARGIDGTLHLSFVWRTDSLGQEGRINNINICYAKSHDNGLTWLTSLDRPYRLPITQVNAETVHAVSPGSNLINQTSMALDSRNRPHIVFYANDAAGIPQYQHAWFDGKTWRHGIISRREKPFDLAGGGTLQIPISRPEVLLDREDNLLVIYRGDLTYDRMTIVKLLAPDYRHEPRLTATLWDDDVGFAEPIIDRTRWEREAVLTMLLQRNQQPMGDVKHELLETPVSLVDFHIEQALL